MKSSIFHESATDRLLQRVSSLTPDAPRQWGTMNAPEMLAHCNIANDFILQSKINPKGQTLKQQLITLLALHILPRFPKNHKGPARVDVKGKVDPQRFEAERQRYIDTMHTYLKRKDPITSMHPSMGYLSHDQWGYIVWMHMDHHLRQFGV